MEIILYTDGACSNNPGPGGYGYVILQDGKEYKGSGSKKNTTNNEMELNAVVEGLKKIFEINQKDKDLNIKIYSDSAYIVNSFNQGWIYNWKKNGYKKSDGTNVKNVEYFDYLYNMTYVNNIEFIKVKGHSGNHYNEICDRLAVNAINNLSDENFNDNFNENINNNKNKNKKMSIDKSATNSVCSSCKSNDIYEKDCIIGDVKLKMVICNSCKKVEFFSK